MEYRDYNDYELLSYISENNEDAHEIIFKKYEPMITSTARKMYRYCKNSGLELNDLIQEGMIGLSQAIEHFKEQKDASFYTFAKTCVDRKIISLVVSSTRLKHKILNESLSLEITDQDGKTIPLENILSDESYNPENMLLDSEYETELLTNISQKLTDFEKQVFELKMNDFNYKEIANILDKSPKAIDNALQRIRIKIKGDIA